MLNSNENLIILNTLIILFYLYSFFMRSNIFSNLLSLDEYFEKLFYFIYCKNNYFRLNYNTQIRIHDMIKSKVINKH